MGDTGVVFSDENNERGDREKREEESCDSEMMYP